jgi:hypothetical protein
MSRYLAGFSLTVCRVYFHASALPAPPPPGHGRRKNSWKILENIMTAMQKQNSWVV